jgi:hypothetical protein
MHRENCSSPAWRASSDGPGPGELDDERVAVLDREPVAFWVRAVPGVELVGLRTDATAGARERPPHPATRSALAIAAAASATARDDRISSCGWTPFSIGGPFVRVRFYAADGYGKVSLQTR